MKYNILEELLSVNEAVKDIQFKITIDAKDYIVIRDSHLLQKRKGDPKPKDFNMSKSKYQKLFTEALKSNMNLNKAFSVEWQSNNGKYNIISAILVNDTFEVFGAIMSSKTDSGKLYPVAKQRLNLNTL